MGPLNPGEGGVELRRERVWVETTRYRITGIVTLAAEGYRSRLSDLLNQSDREFLPLTEVTVEPHDGGAPEAYDFMAVARRHIIFASSTAGA